ncbi:aspartate aminotransferase family protein [Eshraghiella crossota]|uniref:aspartate aminotransferase family protein n=1 Tax=Eshraghiella crossota TaxID=45851 RepID=UPI003FF11B97
MTKTSNIIDKVENNIIHTYNRYQIALDSGSGMYLYDAEGKKYLDFGSGIGVFALGYGNKEYNDAVKAQVDKLIHTSNYFYNEPSALASEKFVKASGMTKVFYTNSGAEAVEGALKLAKKYGKMTKGDNCYEIIAMNKSFHGRTIGAVSVTGNEHYRESFEPLLPGVKFADYNNLESVKALISDRTCAVIMETIQGEGGVTPATEEFVKGVRTLCDENNILMIADEIQCGMGRSGYMFAYQRFGILPDIVTSAKALGCGVPIGAFAAGSKVCDVLCAGDHGTTYGGNPLACAASLAVFNLFEKNNLLENVVEVGAYLYKRLDEIKVMCPSITDHRGIGFMQGLEYDHPVSGIIQKLLDAGLIVFSAGPNVIRFLPPLIATMKDVDDMINILKEWAIE